MPVSITRLSFSSAKEALETGLDAIRNGRCAFDLGGIAAADSSSIAVMLAWQRTAKSLSKALRFLNTPDSILSLAELYGVTGLLELEKPANVSSETAH